jgi:hypothetical protein
MTVPVAVVDVEAMVSTFLREQTEVTDLCGDRVYTDLPHDRVYPLVLITRIGGGFIINAPFLWLQQASIQLDTFGGTHKQAHRLMEACLSTMVIRMVTQRPEGCCTGVVVDDIAYNPEIDFIDDLGHARPRFTTSASVLAHP